eukprot:701006-Amphidinium_carterae.2
MVPTTAPSSRSHQAWQHHQRCIQDGLCQSSVARHRRPWLRQDGGHHCCCSGSQRRRLPSSHCRASGHTCGRDRDQVYMPPGRPRTYDLIILDEISQIDERVWEKLRLAFAELLPSPYIVLVGDFQQLNLEAAPVATA